MAQIKVLIADDHALVRMGLRLLIGSQKDLRLVAEVKNGREAVEAVERLRPDVAVLDLMMPQLNGSEAAAKIKASCPDTKVVVLTSYEMSNGIAQALRNGARGAMLKNADNAQLAQAIRKVAGGGEYVSPEIRQQLAVNPPIPDLTPRQEEILASMIRGLTDRDIARQLGIRQDGVNEHVSAILRKIGAANRTEAVAIALRKHLLKI